MGRIMRKRRRWMPAVEPICRGVLLGLVVLAAVSCTSVSPQVQERNARIAQEPRGDYYIGRRYFVRGSRVWGWIRQPGEVWNDARLTVINERNRLLPDRVKEGSVSNGRYQGYDHNREYRLTGYFTNDRVYDPTTNLILPEFVLQSYELVDRDPGFLFEPGETRSNTRLLRTYPIPLARP